MVEIRTRGQWKSVQRDYDYIFSRTEDSCLYCLTNQEVALILASLSDATWLTRWYSVTSQTILSSRINELVSGLEAKLMADICTVVSGKLDKVRTTQADIINGQRDAVYAASSGNPQSIDSRVPNQTSPLAPDARGMDALCEAVDAWVRHRLNDEHNLMLALLGVAVADEVLLSTLLGPLGAIIGGAAIIYAGLSIEALEAAMADSAAIKHIACQLYDALIGVNNTQANFTSAIDGLTATGDHETTIVNILKATAGSSSYLGGTQRLSNWLHFEALLGGSYGNVDTGLVGSCTCDTWCYDFNFRLSDGGWVQWFGEGARYVAGEGWADITRSNGYKGLEVIRYFDASNITEIDVVIDNQNVSAPGVYVGTDPGGYYFTENGVEGQHTYYRTGLSLTGITSILINAYATSSTNIYLREVKIKGTGTNPFGADNCG